MKNLAITVVLATFALSCSNSSDTYNQANTSVDVEKNVITVELEQGTITFTDCFDLQNLNKKQIDSVAQIAAEEALVQIKNAEQIKIESQKYIDAPKK